MTTILNLPTWKKMSRGFDSAPKDFNNTSQKRPKIVCWKLVLQDSQDTKEENDEDEDIRKWWHDDSSFLERSEFEKNYLGSRKKLFPQKSIQENGISEELRLAYVGITRAKEELIMTYWNENLWKKHRSLKKQVPPRPSRSFIEQDRTTFGHLTWASRELKKDFLPH